MRQKGRLSNWAILSIISNPWQNIGRTKEEEKNIRKDKDLVKEQLFSIFQKHQYYMLHDLIKLTKQPIDHLKEILKEICVSNPSGVRRGTYKLKLEYRHYKEWTFYILHFVNILHQIAE